MAAGRRKGRPRGGREAEGEAGRPPAATTSSSIRRSCSSPSTNRSATRPSSIARSAGKRTWPAPASSRPSDAGKLRFGAKIVNLVGDRTQPGGLATTGFDDEGVKAERWHLVRDGMFVDWQTTRELAPLVGQTAIARLPARGQLVERAVPAHAERVARAGGHRGHRSTSCSATSSAGSSSRAAACSSIDQQRYNFQFGGAVIREITQRQARRDGAGTRPISRGRRTSGRRATASAARRPIGCGARRPTARASPGQTNAVSHGCPPARFRNITVLNTAAV